MIKMKKRRFLSLFLSLVLVLTAIGVFTPDAFVQAVDSGSIVVVACSDFQHPSGNTAGQGVVRNLIGKIKDAGYTTADGFLCCGDYSHGNLYNETDAKNCIDALKSVVTEQYGADIDATYVQGNHDQVSIGAAGMALSGNNDTDNYGEFVINEDDYMWYNNNENRIKQTGANLKSYLDEKRRAGYTKPIFIISHLPLHYCMRTRNDGDGQYAKYIFNELNEAGAAGLNIIFMFGHNHSHGWDDYLGGAAIYQAKGEELLISDGTRNNYTRETLNFTYLNAGYVGYYYGSESERNAGADDTLTMTVFEIQNDKIIVSRVDQNGLHNMKSSGVSNESEGHNEKVNGNYDPLTNVVTSPAEITLSKTVIPPEGATAEPGPSGTGRVYEKVTAASKLQNGDKVLMIYDGSDGGSYSFMLPKSVEKSNGSGTRVGFDLESADGVTGATVVGNAYEAKEWTFTESGSGWKIGDGSKYAKLTSTSNTGITATLDTSGDIFTVNANGEKFNFQDGSNYLNYNSRGVINGYASKPAAFTLYRYTGHSIGVTDPTAPPAAAVYTQVTSSSQLQDNDKVVMIYNGSFSDPQNNVYSEVAFMLPKSVSKEGSGSTRTGFDLDTNGVSTGATLTGDMTGKVWTFKQSGSGWLIGDGSKYAKFTSSGSSIAATLETTGDVFTIDGSAGDFRFITGDNALNWNKRGVVNGFAKGQNPAGFYLYRLTEGSAPVQTTSPTATPTSAPTATPTAPPSGSTPVPTQTPDPSKKYGYKQIKNLSELKDNDMVVITYNGSFSDGNNTSEVAYMLPKVVTRDGSSGVRVGFDLENTTVPASNAFTGNMTGKVWVFKKSGSGWMFGDGSKYAKLTSTSNQGITATLENTGDVFTIDGSAGNFSFVVGDNALNWNSRVLINGYDKNQNPAGFYLFRYQEITDADLATPSPSPTPTVRPTRTPKPSATPDPEGTPVPGVDDATPTPAPTAVVPGNATPTPNPGVNPSQGTTPTDGTVAPGADTGSQNLLKIISVKAKKNTRKITGKLSIAKAKVKIKVGKNKFKKAKVKGKNFTLKLSYKLKKKTKVTVNVTKKGYKAVKKTIKVK